MAHSKSLAAWLRLPVIGVVAWQQQTTRFKAWQRNCCQSCCIKLNRGAGMHGHLPALLPMIAAMYNSQATPLETRSPPALQVHQFGGSQHNSSCSWWGGGIF